MVAWAAGHVNRHDLDFHYQRGVWSSLDGRDIVRRFLPLFGMQGTRSQVSQDTSKGNNLGKRRLSFGSTASGGSAGAASAGSWGRFEENAFQKCLRFYEDPIGTNIANTGACGVGRVVREAWDNLDSKFKEAGRKLASQLMDSPRNLEITTLCSGTDGVVDAAKDSAVPMLVQDAP
eukprot:s4146_g9.t1